MKQFFAIIALLGIVFTACQSNATDANTAANTSFGEKITADSAVQVADLIARLDAKQGFTDVEIEGGNSVQGFPAKLEGKVVEVCKHAGCWATMQTTDGKEVFVKVKDDAFKLPADVVGKTLVVKGNAFQNVTSVEELRHFAQDAGKTQDQIAQITQPEVEYKIVITGAQIKQ